MTKFAKLDYCTYVLFSEADGKLYIGYTTDLHYSNPELWATPEKKPQVAEQLERYRTLLGSAGVRERIVTAYGEYIESVSALFGLKLPATGGIEVGAPGTFASRPTRYQHRRRLSFSSRAWRKRDSVRVSRSASAGSCELGAGQPGSLCCCCCCPGCCCCDWQPGSCWRCCSNCRRDSRGSSPVDGTPHHRRFPIDDCRFGLPPFSGCDAEPVYDLPPQVQ
jgi:hypothetical protein